jgi:hypothetical protein
LNAELISCWGEETMGLEGATDAAGAGGGEDRPNKSFDRDEEGGLGLADLVVGEANPPKPKSCPLEIEALRD